MRLLADANWLIRLERELEREEPGPARRLLASQRVHVNPISQAESLSAGATADRLRILARLVRLPPISYDEASEAGELRYRSRRRGKTLTPLGLSREAGTDCKESERRTRNRHSLANRTLPGRNEHERHRVVAEDVDHLDRYRVSARLGVSSVWEKTRDFLRGSGAIVITK